MSNYIVTGAAGFIASRVSEMLLNEGHSVFGIDNLNDAYDPRLKTWRLERLQKHSNFQFFQLDVSDRAALRALEPNLPEISAIVNLAARAGVRQSVENPHVYIETNVTGTVNLLEICRSRGIPKFVLASTSSLYGSHNPMPYREDADTSCPLSPYAASKKAAESMCFTYHSLHGIDVSILRYFTVYGPAGRPDMSVFRFTQWINEGRAVVVFGDGSQSRDFTFVDDIARGTIAAIRPLGFQTINLGSDKPVVLMDLVRLLERLLDRKAKVEFQPAHRADVTATWADISRAKDVLTWSPRTTCEQGVSQFVQWYRDNKWASEIATV